ncbi:response regulator [Spirosoma pollinicola]|uniref:Response regulator n=1 Tax=Spirosoma pollinicola TaxID=2057025 RepID=A0A2K8Z7P3_9BACT|nr:response regulator [Spirosoma pollinicola]AUD05868.1 response regulator [Spirosoma pollinicola]
MKTTTSLIYMADDDADDRYFIRQAIHATDPSVTIIEAEDGDHLLSLLDNWSQEPSPHPVHLILLDINMPKSNGLETLLVLKANPMLQYIPTVMFSTSAHPDQVATAYQSGINSYIQKPVSSLDMKPIAQALNVCFLNAGSI